MHTIQEQSLQQLYAYWAAKRHGRRMPCRSDIDPVDIPRLLPNLMLLDVVPAASPSVPVHRYRFRLAGTAICQVAGFDLTGCWLDELLRPGSYTDYVMGLADQVVCSGCASYSRTTLILEGGSRRSTARMICPLGSGERASMLLAAQVFDAIPRWAPLSEADTDYEFVELARDLLP